MKSASDSAAGMIYPCGAFMYANIEKLKKGDGYIYGKGYVKSAEHAGTVCNCCIGLTVHISNVRCVYGKKLAGWNQNGYG
jgi:hypothetical protein